MTDASIQIFKMVKVKYNLYDHLVMKKKLSKHLLP